MTSRQQTQSLILLLIASAIASGIAWSFLDACRNRAAVSQKDRVIAVSEMSSMKITASAVADKHAGPSVDLEINRRLRGAVVAAHLAADQLASIDPGSPVRLNDSDYMQTPVYLRLNGVSLKQLVDFLYALSMTDDTLRTSDIELSPPLTAPMTKTDPSDLWTADITLSCLSYQQREPSENR